MTQKKPKKKNWWEWLDEHSATKFIIELVVFPLISGLVVGGAILIAENQNEESRLQKSESLENVRALRAERLENLRFVRDRSSTLELDRPFSTLNLSEQSLSGLQLKHANFTGANLSLVNALSADLENARLRSADLTQITTRAANFQNANFDGATLVRAVLETGDFRGACFHNANLDGAFIWAAKFENASFVGANLKNVEIHHYQHAVQDGTSKGPTESELWATFQNEVFYDESTKWPAGFEPEISSKPPENDIC